MSILIKDMEMPKTCAGCEWSYYVGNGRAMCKRVCMTDKADIMTKRRADFCPLVEVPPHGRLIDADAFDERVRVAGGMSEEELTEDFKDGVQVVLYMMKSQTTIIAAEGSEA